MTCFEWLATATSPVRAVQAAARVTIPLAFCLRCLGDAHSGSEAFLSCTTGVFAARDRQDCRHRTGASHVRCTTVP